MSKRIYMLSFSHSIEELKGMEAKIDALELPMEFWTKFHHITEFCCRCYEINDFDSLFLGEEKIVKELLVMTNELKLNGTYQDVTAEVFNGQIDITKTPFTFKKNLLKYYFRNCTIDDVLDKILLQGGVKALNRFDLIILKAF